MTNEITMKPAIIVIDNGVDAPTYATSDINFARTLNKVTPTKFKIGDTITFIQDDMIIRDIKIELWIGSNLRGLPIAGHIKTGEENEYNTLIFLYCDKI